MENRYLVLTGNEYGYNITDTLDLAFVNKKDAEDRYNMYLREYDCAVMYELDLQHNRLNLIKQDARFE
jgi:hypothetical protein